MKASFADDDLTMDRILGGRVRLHQPVRGYRAGVDPVLLAATLPARTGETVLELGCGGGPGLCCLGARVPGLRLMGVEVQPCYAALARDNLALNGLEGEIITADLAAPPPVFRDVNAHHVFANPPYFEPGKRRAADDPGREAGLAGATPLSAWVAQAAKRTRPKGTVTFIQRAERLPELLAGFASVLGSVELWPLLPRTGRGPRLVLVRGRKNGRAPFRFHPGLVLHEGPSHERDAPDYTAPVRAALFDGAALPFPV